MPYWWQFPSACFCHFDALALLFRHRVTDLFCTSPRTRDSEFLASYESLDRVYAAEQATKQVAPTAAALAKTGAAVATTTTTTTATATATAAPQPSASGAPTPTAPDVVPVGGPVWTSLEIQSPATAAGAAVAASMIDLKEVKQQLQPQQPAQRQPESAAPPRATMGLVVPRSAMCVPLFFCLLSFVFVVFGVGMPPSQQYRHT